MKIVLLKLSPFALLAIVILIIRNNLFDDRFIMPNNYKSKINNAIVLLGDSKASSGFNDSILDKFSNKKMYNLSFWGASPVNINTLVKNITISNSTIFLNISSRIYINHSFGEEKYRYKEIFNENILDKYLMYKTKSGPGKWEYEKSKYGSMYFTHLISPYRLYKRNEDSINTSKAIKIDSVNNKFYKYTLNVFIELYDYLKKNNNKVYLIDLPERDCYNTWVKHVEISMYKKLDSITNKNIIDFGVYPDSLFYDGHHLNILGGRRFTNEFIERFKNVINK